MKSMRLSVANDAMGLKEVSFVADQGSCKELMGLIELGQWIQAKSRAWDVGIVFGLEKWALHLF